MQSITKSLSIGIISFLVVVGFTAPTAVFAADGGFLGYGGGGGSFLFPTAGSQRAQLYVTSWGPTQTSQYPSYSSQNYPSYPSYQGNTLPQYSSYYPQQTSYTNPYMYQTSYPSYDAYNSKFTNYNYVTPFVGNTVPSYGVPNYTSQNNYSYPSYNNYPSYNTGYAQPYSYSNSFPQYSYSNPSYGYYAPPTGGSDLWGNQMCNWGSDYGNFPCDRDPHQWVYDPYSGTYY